MDFAHIALLAAAGLSAGTVNAIAGGGSLITFPTLLAVGLPPIAANVTNSLAVCPGYVSSVVGSRGDLAGQRRLLTRIVPTALAGGVAGCALLLLTPPRPRPSAVRVKRWGKSPPASRVTGMAR